MCTQKTVLHVGDIAVSDGVGFTVDSDLNGASPQFTLTCISTGGPATTVTWTRDNDTVTEGTETVLDDRVIAQYNHTLTVTGRLGGLYTCTVANDKPSVDSVQLFVKGVTIILYSSVSIIIILVLSSDPSYTAFSLLAGDPPEGAPEMFEAVAGQRQVNFSWSPPPVTQRNGVIISYTLSCSPSPSSLPQSPSQSGTLTVAGFSPDTSYTCSLVASNSQGSGPAANTSFTTLEDCKND